VAWQALPVVAAVAQAALQQPRQPAAALRAVVAAARAVPRVLPAGSVARSRQAPAVAAAGSPAPAAPAGEAAGSSAAVAGSPAAVVLEAALAARRIAAASRQAACGWRCRETIHHRADARRQPEAVGVVAGRPRSALLHWEQQRLALGVSRVASDWQSPAAAQHAATADRPAMASRCPEQVELQDLARSRSAQPQHCWAARHPADGRRRPGAVGRPAPGPSPADGCYRETA
jgi:hypothetical protein